MTNDTHLKSIGYILWIFGFTGSHRFYYEKPISGTIGFFTFGLCGIGWLARCRTCKTRYRPDVRQLSSPSS